MSDRAIRAAEGYAARYMARVRAGEKEHSPFYVRVVGVGSLTTALHKRAIKVRLLSYGGEKFTLYYWLHSSWYRERLVRLLDVLNIHPPLTIIPALAGGDWFWLRATEKTDRLGKTFWDLDATTEIPE